MNERPILMRGPLVIASLEDRKWQTRRVVKPQFGKLWGQGVRHGEDAYSAHVDIPAPDGWRWIRCPYGKVGNHLWVRETWARHPDCGGILYRATDPGWDGNDYGIEWKPSIHMPRWASRLKLEITGVRVERVQEITEADCCAEMGAPLAWTGDGPEPYKRDLIGAFANLWNAINARKGFSWEVNPWVWAISYRRMPQATERSA